MGLMQEGQKGILHKATRTPSRHVSDLINGLISELNPAVCALQSSMSGPLPFTVLLGASLTCGFPLRPIPFPLRSVMHHPCRFVGFAMEGKSSILRAWDIDTMTVHGACKSRNEQSVNISYRPDSNSSLIRLPYQATSLSY